VQVSPLVPVTNPIPRRTHGQTTHNTTLAMARGNIEHMTCNHTVLETQVLSILYSTLSVQGQNKILGKIDRVIITV
jgi:hypothetical protein